MRGHGYTIAAMLLAVGSAAAAEDAPICADRPGKATATCTVPPGRWQIETGIADWSLQRTAGERDTTFVVGETTVKYGLTDGSDIEVDVTPWQRATSRSGGVRGRASGFGDMTILYKQRLTSSGAAVQVAVMPFVKVPTARHALGNGKWEGGLMIPVGYAIPNSPLSIGFTPELDWLADADGRGRHVAMAQVASLGWQASDRLNLSGEIWGQWDWGPAGTVRQASADGSVAYLIASDIQLDAGINVGINRSTPDVELYGGVSKRF